MPQTQVLCVLPSNAVSPTKYCCVILNQLKKDLNQLQLESQRVQSLEEEYNKKLETFLEVSMAVDTKLCHLWALGHQVSSVNYCKGLEVYAFTNRMGDAWGEGDEAIARDVQSVQLVSFTTSSVPLTFILDKIQSGVTLAKETILKISCHVSCMGNFTKLCNQITPLIAHLQDGNTTLRYFMSLCKAVPYLKELETVITRFTENVMQDTFMEPHLQDQIHPIEVTNPTIKREGDLSAFPCVVQLITGELLGHEQYLDHHSKMEPVVKHEIPEIPITSYSRNPMQFHNTQNMAVVWNPMWNYGNMVPPTNSAQTGIGAQQLRGEYLASYYPTTGWQQYNNYTPNNCESTVTSGSLSQNYLSSGFTYPTKANGNNETENKIPEIKSKPATRKMVSSQNLVSVLLLESTENGNMLQGFGGNTRKSVTSVAKRTRTKRMSYCKRMKMTRNIRVAPKPVQEANDLPPIKIPCLKHNLLAPLS